MSEPLNINDLINGKEDLDTIAEVAMVGTSGDTTINRQGVQVDTIEGRLKKIGFAPPLAYAAGITFTGPLDAVKTVDNGGIIYGCLASARPFTTTGNFANDVASFFVVQDGNQAVGDVRTDASNTYQAGTTQSFDTATANTFNLGGQDLQQKIDQAKKTTINIVLLTTLGSGTWVKPEGVTSYKVSAMAGGAGGGGGFLNAADISGFAILASGGGGGDGATAVGVFTSNSDEEEIDYFIGNGGLGGSGLTQAGGNIGTSGTRGGPSWFMSETDLKAFGGFAGTPGNATATTLQAGVAGEGDDFEGALALAGLSARGQRGRDGAAMSAPISSLNKLSLPPSQTPPSSTTAYGRGGVGGGSKVDTALGNEGYAGEDGEQGAILIEYYT